MVKDDNDIELLESFNGKFPSEKKTTESLQTRPNDVSINILQNNGQKGRTYGAIGYEKFDNDDPFRPNGSALGTLQSATYTWHDIDVFTVAKTNPKGAKKHSNGVASRKQILKKVSGIAHPGELLAIMGSSGAGKTTLLNTLTFRSNGNVTVRGARCVNGVPVNGSSLASISAYVQQDDLFIGTLTVKEHLIFQAMVRMDKHIPYNQRMRRVNEVISELALTKCQNTVIGIPGRLRGISGGELKRLSFAAEVLTNPLLMFCDEPTSGLDSFMAQNVIQVLKKLAEAGKTVVCTIHQPSSEIFAMFDKLLLMAQGRVAFLGTKEEAGAFFHGLGAVCPVNYNPADYYVHLLAVVPSREEQCKKSIDTICNCFQICEYGQRVNLQTAQCVKSHLELDRSTEENRVTSPYKANWWRQFRAVFWRSWISVIKDPILIKVRLLQTLMVSILVGIIFFHQKLDQDGVMNINGALFLFLTNMTFQNVFAVINVFCTELPVFLREHKNGMYRTDVYFLCKTLAEAPVFVMIPLVFALTSYYMIGLNTEMPRVFITAGIVALVANVAISFGYLISCISTNLSMALSIGPPVIIPFLLFGGFFLNTGSVPFYFEWLSYLSWFRYGNEALLINQWHGVAAIDCTRANFTCPKNGDVVLETLNFHENDFAMDIYSLIGLMLLFRFAAFLALLQKTYKGER